MPRSGVTSMERKAIVSEKTALKSVLRSSRHNATIGKQSRLPFAPSSAEKPVSSTPSNPSTVATLSPKKGVLSWLRISQEEGSSAAKPAEEGSSAAKPAEEAAKPAEEVSSAAEQHGSSACSAALLASSCDLRSHDRTLFLGESVATVLGFEGVDEIGFSALAWCKWQTTLLSNCWLRPRCHE